MRRSLTMRNQFVFFVVWSKYIVLPSQHKFTATRRAWPDVWRVVRVNQVPKNGQTDGRTWRCALLCVDEVELSAINFCWNQAKTSGRSRRRQRRQTSPLLSIRREQQTRADWSSGSVVCPSGTTPAASVAGKFGSLSSTYGLGRIGTNGFRVDAGGGRLEQFRFLRGT